MPFFSLFLVAGTLAIIVIALVIFIGRYAERGLKLQESDQLLTELQHKLEQVLIRQEGFAQRLEHLETIVTAEAWDALPEPSPSTDAALDLPDEPSNEEKAATLARRLRNT